MLRFRGFRTAYLSAFRLIHQSVTDTFGGTAIGSAIALTSLSPAFGLDAALSWAEIISRRQFMPAWTIHIVYLAIAASQYVLLKYFFLRQPVNEFALQFVKRPKREQRLLNLAGVLFLTVPVLFALVTVNFYHSAFHMPPCAWDCRVTR